ncbi:MAG TPA: DUF3300 domain-containing protein [Candidatus Sulfotelmatobacter sp.]|nr:DUF3300 domain-containing protein [Candidatus Sulfotelmatobacter sp.]
MKTIFNLTLMFVFGLAVFVSMPRAQAQDQVPPPMPAGQTFSDAQLQQLLGPIALYPDPLIANMLPAATLPTEIVMADRYVSGGGDPNQIDQQPWDPNVQALAHYPAVLKWMDDNLNWTTQLGEAFQNQQDDVMNAIQELRTEAYNLGNLQSTPEQQVVDDNGYIEIIPANPDDLYVPQYQPDQVYYDQPIVGGTPYITFGVGFVIGPWLCGDFDWHNRHLIYWDRDHPRPAGWWNQTPQFRANYFAAGHANVWNPANRATYNAPAWGDRGYDNHLPWTAPAVNRPAPAPVEQRPNAFIGIQNSQDTRDYSDRGEHSMETMPQFRNLGAFHGGEPAGGQFHGGGAPAGGGYHGGGSPPAGGGGGGGGRR